MTNRLGFAFSMALLTLLTACGDDPAGEDAGIDSAVDSSVACTTNADCDDGSRCNGTETCGANGFCEAGTPVVCDDGIACTLNLCSETLGCQFPAPDMDGDGYRDASCLDGDGLPLGDDCDDNDINRFPDNIEFCDAEDHDEDCNIETFGALDRDGDGFLDASCCNSDGDSTFCGNDCDDLRGNVNLAATEACDGVDNNCNNEVDEGVAQDGFVDEDRDGHGDPTKPLRLCAGSIGFSLLNDDCDDTNASIHGDQLELCDSVDNDCDTAVDEEENSVPWYKDNDGDGFGSETSGLVVSCTPVTDHVLLNTDCDDSNPAINPSSAELCDGLDNDCSGSPDFSLGPNDFEDDDGDGLVDIRCSPLGTDCNDRDPNTGPGTPERCDGVDNDCDTRVDEDSDGRVWFLDGDGDGFGSVNSGTTVSCSPVPGFQQQSGDCADSDPSRFPGAPELCNAIDDDCNFVVDDGAPAPAGCAPANGVGACDSGSCGVLSCNTGFEDCDRRPENGCEADLSSPSNCGGCFVTCNFPNADASCVSGSCVMGACSAPFGDCTPAPGCETILTTSSNCGGCGNTCSVPGGLAVCADGTCLAVECPDGFDDCDADPSDCETPVNSAANCGECGRQCNGNNGTAVCMDGDCQISCNPGFDDCNGDPSDGCEADLSNDIMNCSSCGFFCGGPDANYTCNAGLCEITSCIGGRLDCDGDPQNGCEVDPQTDPVNCGGCSTGPGSMFECDAMNANSDCVAGSCEVGSCFPDFADCNTNPMDGCEVDIQFDPFNCGGCSTGPGSMFECDATNGSPRCEFGLCRIDSCFPNFDDCNLDPMDGCEADLFNDPMNCGTCGTLCGVGGTCFNGACDRIVEVAQGHDFGCAIRESGTAVCWGANDKGQLGNGGGAGSFTPVVVERQPSGMLNGVRSITAGFEHACAITDTGTFCWGENADGQLGDGSFAPSNRATQVMLDPGFVQIDAGANHTCGVTAMGDVYCFGDDSAGQLGNGTGSTADLNIPTAIALLGTMPVVARKVVAGVAFSCALEVSGAPTCWGFNGDGQLGNGTTVSSEDPTFFSTFPNATDIVAGGEHACLIRNIASDFIECWGRGDEQQNGDMSAMDRTSPGSLPSGILNPRFMVAGAAHTCAINDVGNVYCWGQNNQAQLGDGTSSGTRASPLLISFGPMDTLSSSGSTANHSCGFLNDGSVFCWGANAEGQVGIDPLMDPVTIPVGVTGLP